MIDPLLARFDGLPQTEPAAETAIPSADKITLLTLNYFENEYASEKWIKANRALLMQFFIKTDRFTPHYSLCERACTCQFHEPFWWEGYIADYAKEYAGTRSVPSGAQLALAIETAGMSPDARLEQLYDHAGGGTTYHWGNAVRLRSNKYGDLIIDLFLDCKLFGTLLLDEPNNDKNEKTANIKWRGKYDPNKLWIVKSKKVKSK